VNVVYTRRARETGLPVSVIDNRDGSFDTDDWPWATLCEDHGDYCTHETRRLAERFAPVPSQWCATCQQLAAEADACPICVPGQCPGPDCPGRDDCPLHHECDRYLPAGECDYRSGRISFARAEELADTIAGSPR